MFYYIFQQNTFYVIIVHAYIVSARTHQTYEYDFYLYTFRITLEASTKDTFSFKHYKIFSYLNYSLLCRIICLLYNIFQEGEGPLNLFIFYISRRKINTNLFQEYLGSCKVFLDENHIRLKLDNFTSNRLIYKYFFQ